MTSTPKNPDAYRNQNGDIYVEVGHRQKPRPDDQFGYTPLWFTDRDPSTTVTLDPESEADVKRLASLAVRLPGYTEWGPNPAENRKAWAREVLAALAQPVPEPTSEPTPEPENLGAVVVDAHGGTYVRVPDVVGWVTGSVHRDWPDLSQPVTVLHPGYDPSAEEQA